MSNNMAGGVPGGPETQGDTGPQLALQNVYLKDCSYEAPNGPRVDGNWNPQINLDLHTSATALTPELREVILTVPRDHKAEAKPDPLLKELNTDESFSLLKCKQPWTLAVATFQGAAIIQSQ